MKYRLYICGPMTGLPNENRPAFAAAEAKLIEAGYDVFNPAAQPDVPGWQTADYLIERDLPALRRCHGVAMLDGWRGSFGANVEYCMANDLGMFACPLDWWIGRCFECYEPVMAAQVARVAALPPETCSIVEWNDCLYPYGKAECGADVDGDPDTWQYCPACGRKLRTTP